LRKSQEAVFFCQQKVLVTYNENGGGYG